jgi:predicted acyltransferase
LEASVEASRQRLVNAPERLLVPEVSPRGERLLALDVFRGMTVAGMLLVNNPGTWSAIYPPLEHAPWNGWTPTDLIFPFFLFIVGITTELSLASRRARGDDESAILRQVLKRGFLIFLFGLLLSWFPFYQYTAIDGIPNPTLFDRMVFRVEHLRIMGVLQRIGVAYLLGALITLRTGLKAQLTVLAVILLGYWALMTLVPVPDTGIAGRFVLDKPDQVLSAWLDRTILGTNHLWINAKTWDPEGLLSTMPAVGTMMLGTFTGKWIGRREAALSERLSAMFAVGGLTMMLGLVWNWVFPINKSLWTSSYVLFSGGMAAVVLATCLWLIDVRGYRSWTRPLVVYGLNPMLAFLASGMLARTMGSWVMLDVNGTPTPLQSVVYERGYASWLSPINASLAFAISFVILFYIVLLVAQKRGFVLKV